MRKIRLFICLVLVPGFLFCQFSFDSIFSKNPLLTKLSRRADKYHLQIIYTQISYESGKPVFQSYFYNVKPGNYFYCASLVKLPVSILALQKLNELGLKQNTIMFTDSSISCHKTVRKDTTSENTYPNVEHYIKKMLLVSDNESYSRTYEFLGVDYIHKNLEKKEYPDVRIISRYDGQCSGKENLITNPVTFLDSNLKILFRQEEQRSILTLSAPKNKILIGKAYYDQKNKRISSPKDFSWSNYLSLTDCNAILRQLIYSQGETFAVSAEQRNFLIRYLSYYPSQSRSPKYDSKIYYDSYKKYLFYGDSKSPIKDTNIIITNIVGQSYGFMSDCAHFSDKKNQVEFMLSAVIYANEDEVLNDGKYDYQTIALPYLAELGRQFYKYELKRAVDNPRKK